MINFVGFFEELSTNYERRAQMGLNTCFTPTSYGEYCGFHAKY
mgnify:CR=1 FL=1